jgi:hypothetical protein
MSFAWFRKYEKPFMWGTVIFSVLIFATFSGFGDLKALLQRRDIGVAWGQFTLETTGKTVDIGEDEYRQISQRLNRFNSAVGQRQNVSEDAIWQFIILREEARAAGLAMSDKDVGDFVGRVAGALLRGQPITRDTYTMVWRDILGFSSARDMEDFFRELLLGDRYASLKAEAAGLVTADEVYLQWRQDNERFDYDGLVIADLPLDQVPDPSGDELKTMWDALPEQARQVTYRDPRRLDIAYAWATLAPGEHGLADDKLAGIAEPPADEIDAAFQQDRAKRWPEAKELTDEIRAALVREAKVIELVRKAHEDFEAGQDKGADAFRAAMEAAGLSFADPVGLLSDDELDALPDIGGPLLSGSLSDVGVGATWFGDPREGYDQHEVHVVLVQGVQDARPFSFEEAHDQLVKNWKDGRRDKPAKDWREALTKAARERSECQTALQPLLDAANKRADEAAAALTDATDEARAAKRKEILDQAESTEIKAKVAEFEHLVWADVPRPEGTREVSFKDVSRSYARKPNGDEPVASIERMIKISPEIYRLGVDAVSSLIRRGASNESAAVIIRARSFPEQTAMAADSEGLERSRNTLSSQRRYEYSQANLSPDAVVASHKLKLSELADKKTKKPEPAIPPDA